MMRISWFDLEWGRILISSIYYSILFPFSFQFFTRLAAVFAEEVTRPSATGKSASVVLRLTDQGESAGMIPV